jgi:hypothetical protein
VLTCRELTRNHAGILVARENALERIQHKGNRRQLKEFSPQVLNDRELTRKHARILVARENALERIQHKGNGRLQKTGIRRFFLPRRIFPADVLD